MILKPHHKRAARYFLVGLTPTEISERIKTFTPKQVKSWMADLAFKKYLLRLQTRYIKALDADIVQLRRTVLARLQTIIEDPNTNHRHFEWALGKAFAFTLMKTDLQEMNLNVTLREGKPAETKAHKDALKELIRVSGDADRYTYAGGKMGEA